MVIILGYKCREAVAENGFPCNGVIDISDENEAAEIVGKMKAMLPSVPKYQYARFRGVIMQICFAVGPEFTEQYGNIPKIGGR